MPVTREALRAIEGIGRGKADKNAEDVFTVLASLNETAAKRQLRIAVILVTHSGRSRPASPLHSGHSHRNFPLSRSRGLVVRRHLHWLFGPVFGVSVQRKREART